MCAHAKLSPSKAYQWSSCTASVGLIEKLIAEGRIPAESESSAAADRGTARHDLAARILQGESVDLAPDERFCVMEYVECCREVAEGHPIFVERKVPLYYSKDETGTLDFGCLRADKNTLFLRDYKDGAGVEEVATKNKQLAIYAISFIDVLADLDLIDRDPALLVNMGIIQPNFRGGYFGPSVWEVSYKELLEFAQAEINAGLEELESGNCQFRPDPEDACVFCRAEKLCKAKERFLLADLPELDDLTSNALVPVADAVKAVPAPESLTDEQIARFIAVADPLKKWLNAVQEYAHDRLSNGGHIPGYKLVAGRQGNRAWSDEEAARKLLLNHLSTDEITEKSLISVTKATTLLKGKELSTRFTNKLNSLITRPEGKPTLAPETDERPAISAASQVADMPELPPAVSETVNPLD